VRLTTPRVGIAAGTVAHGWSLCLPPRNRPRRAARA